MATSSGVTIRLDQRAVTSMLARHREASVRRAAGITRDRARGNLTVKRRIRTGRLRNSIRSEKGPASTNRTTYLVGSDEHYAGYQERGVRPFGPKRAKMLRFKPKGSNMFVFAKWVRGFKGAYYMRDAYNDLRPRDFRP